MATTIESFCDNYGANADKCQSYVNDNISNSYKDTSSPVTKNGLLNYLFIKYKFFHKIAHLNYVPCLINISGNSSYSLKNAFVLIVFLATLFDTLDIGYAHGTLLTKPPTHYHHPSDDFSQYIAFRPKLMHGRHKSPIASTLEEEGLHASHITLEYEHHGRNVILDLQLNNDLIPEGHFVRYQTKDGGHAIKNFTRNDVDHCHYHGTIRGNKDSRAAISTCHGIAGVIFDGKDTFYIESGKNGTIQEDHFLYSHYDMTHNATCGYQGTREDHDSEPRGHSEFNRILRYKRAAADPTIRGPYNANKESSFVELILVVDNKLYKSFNDNLKRVHNHCKTIANIINALYMPLNIFIALVGIVVWNESNEVELSSDGDKTLKNFLQYRRKLLVKEYPNDNAQLLTREQFDGGVVGKALKGPICTYEFSGGVSMDHSPIIGVVATTVAHEMGHNFGMEHDTTDCKCSEDRCIMSASSSSIAPKHWSSCSIDQLNLAFHHGMNYCLKNKPMKLFDSPQCGNGFVEPGEQCDCGLPEFCENSCCDPHTCMLHANASCATGGCCDLTTCRPRTAGTICRSADGECDLPEYCTGESEYCPSNVFKRDTESCDGGQAFCYNGSCRSRSDQCKILWGPSGNSSDECYEKNTDGTRHGNCGYDRISNQYINCERQDVYCGMLHCRHLNERLEFGMESVAVLSHSFLSHDGRIVVCRTAIVDLGLQSIDPGLAPDGAKCGEGKMCVNQKCMAVESLRASGRGIACPENCNGHGICNSEGHCHCEKGFAPPLCDSPGTGGSEDSGPASNPNAGVGFTRAMYIIFLGIVPTIALISFLVYYCRQNRPIIKRSPHVPKSIIKQSPSKSLSPSSSGQPKSTPSSPDDMNSALLRTTSDTDSSLLNNNMFGKFKGFTLKPLPNATSTNLGATNIAYVHPVAKTVEDDSKVPSRVAPPVPKVPVVARSQTQITSVKPLMNRTNTTVGRPKVLETVNNATEAPALPPLNPGANPRPLISSPILEASTCTAKELLSPLKNSAGRFPVRAAPHVPPVSKSDSINTNLTNNSDNEGTLPKDSKLNSNLKEKDSKGSTLQRITSFLKKDEKGKNIGKSNSLEKKVHKVIDRERLKTIEISAPIPQVEVENDEKIGINRTQSMRDSSTVNKRPNVSTFSSMRHPAALHRPSSIVGSRPKSPPPRPPAPPSITGMKIPGMPGYQNPPAPKKISDNVYDDCEAVEAPLAHISEENSPSSPDNIYSVIDELPSASMVKPPTQIPSGPGSIDSMGLLGEIVQEIETRNFDSIYSASTLKKKKSREENKDDQEPAYVNTSEINDDSEAEYSAMNMKSSASTTSSGYLRPSAINTPIARVAPSKPDINATALSSFKSAPSTNSSNSRSTSNTVKEKEIASNAKDSIKSKDGSVPSGGYKPYHSTIHRTGPFGAAYKTITAPSSGTTTKEVEEMKQTSEIPKISSPPSPTIKKNLNRTLTPPSLKTTQRLPLSSTTTATTNASIRTRSPSPKGRMNKPSSELTSISKVKTSPDLVSSNTPNPKIKPPDVVTANGAKPQTPLKPNLVAKPVAPATTNKIVRQNSLDKKVTSSKLQNKSMENGAIKANNNSKLVNGIPSSTVSGTSSNKILSVAARPTSGKLSNVASLQQKFEGGQNKSKK